MLVQGALNATNICFEAVSEMELLSTITLKAQQELQSGGTPDFSKLAVLGAAGQLASYATTLGKFVQFYGGGPPFDAIRCLGSLSQEGNSIALGKEYALAVTETEFSKQHLYPASRVALLAVNLTAPMSRVQDGFGRLVTRTDVIGLKGKKMLPQLDQLEEMLQKCWQVALKNPNEALAFKAYGRLQIRSILHILKKGKQGHEDIIFKDFAEIEAKFFDDLVAQGSSAQAASAAAASSGSQGAISTAEAADPMFLAKLRGLDLKVGNVVTHKDHPNKVYTITKVDSTGVQITYKHPVKSFEEKLEVPGKSAITCLKMSKAKLPKLLDDVLLDQAFATTRCQTERARCLVYLELLDCYNQKDVDSSSISVLAMSRLFSKKKFKKGDLVLVPITSAASLLQHQAEGSKVAPLIQAGPEGNFFVMAPKLFKEDKPQEAGIVSPFFLAKADEEKGNMSHVLISFGKMKITCLQNHAAINEGDEILVKTKLDDFLNSILGTAASSSAAPAKAAKKRRKN